MIKVVLDTNILVSALWTPAGNPSTIVGLLFSNKITPCFDQGILNEYRAVLSRPRLSFSSNRVDELLKAFTSRGISVTVFPSSIKFVDEADRKFYDVASYCEAYLISGNIKHFPKKPFIVTPAEFLKIYL